MPAKNRRLVLLGDALRQARNSAAVSQEVLSLESKVDRTYISEIENGHKSPSVEILFRLCPILGVSVSELIARVERSLQSGRK
jgi:HTH-type transcriptional regulator, competence development regulator